MTKDPSTNVPNETEEEASHDESSTYEESEAEQEVYINCTHHNAPQPVYTNMYMPYIKGLKMDWMVNNMLYHRFLKWKLKCKNILECELAALPECQKCKKFIVWSGDFGMDQYVSWWLSKDDMKLDTIWERFEDFCKLQSIEVHAQFDLLTSFHQGNKSVDEWYNAVQAQVNLEKYPPETVKNLHCNIFWFFLYDEDFVSRTITEGSVDLDKFPASRVCQLAKKFESSKATACHIKQVAGDPQATQINIMRISKQNSQQIDTTRREDQPGGQNCTRLPEAQHQIRLRNLMKTESHTRHLTAVINVVTPYMHKDSNALQRSTNARFATNMVTFPVYVTKRRPKCITRMVAEIFKHTNFMQVPYMHRTVPIPVIQKSLALMNHFAYSYKPKAIMLKVSRFQILSIL